MLVDNLLERTKVERKFSLTKEVLGMMKWIVILVERSGLKVGVEWLIAWTDKGMTMPNPVGMMIPNK